MVQMIQKHKFLFLLLIVIQTIFIIAFAFTFLNFHLKILENARGIIEPLQNANYDPDSIDAGKPFLDHPLSVYQSYQAMVRNLYYLIGSVLILTFFFNGLLWAGSQQLVDRQRFSIQRFAAYWSRFAAIFLALVIPFLMLCYALVRVIAVADDPGSLFSSYAKAAAFIFVIIYYFGLVAISSMTMPWKSIVAESWTKAKNLSTTIPVFLINTVFIAASVYFIYRTVSLQSLNSYLVIAT
ncbi:MAG: hypothetical protein Q8R37_00665, partial [Nanoarchaeota archaeon]|nr:hypothetical protein [Nanoarchaeota archaeon]